MQSSSASSSESRFVSPQFDGDCDALLAIAVPNLYRQNAFRVLGLPATATTRAIATQVQKLQVLAGVGRVDPALAGPLPLQPPPGTDAIRSADAILHDPQARILHELFWFWPIAGSDGANDPGFVALKSGDIKAADRIWESVPSGSRERSLAKHNQAVLWHLVALGLELRRGKEEADQSPTETLLRLWPRVLTLWDEVVRSDATWTALAARVLALDDNRLSLDFVQAVRRTIAKALLQIHVRLALDYAERGSWAMASAHVEWVLGSCLKSFSAAEFIGQLISGTKSYFRRRIEDANKLKVADPTKGADLASQLLGAIEPYNSFFELLESEAGDTSWHEIHDEIAETVLSCMIFYQRNKGDESRCIPLLKRALLIVHSEATRSHINQATATLNGNIAHSLLQPYLELITAIQESKSSAEDRLTTFQRELLPKIPQACTILDRYNQPRAEFLAVVGAVLRDISVDAWNQGKDGRTALRALELAESYGSGNDELKTRLKEDRGALERLTAAQRQQRLRQLGGWGFAVGIIIIVIVLSNINDGPRTSTQTSRTTQQSAYTPAAIPSEVPTTDQAVSEPRQKTSLATDTGETYSYPASVAPELDRARASVDQADALVTAARSSLESKEAPLNKLDSELESLRSTLESERDAAEAGGSYELAQYNADVNRYNSMLTTYRRKEHEYNALVSHHNELVDRRNSLAHVYNAKLRAYGHLVGR